jgi:hypothetical protein
VSSSGLTTFMALTAAKSATVEMRILENIWGVSKGMCATRLSIHSLGKPGNRETRVMTHVE